MAARSTGQCRICKSQLTADGQCLTCYAMKKAKNQNKADDVAVEKKDTPTNKTALADYQALGDRKQKKLLQGAFLFNKTTKERYELSSSVNKIGRDRSNNIAIPADHHISRHHAWVLQVQGEFWVEDLGSTNGTLLNGEPIDERKQISSGDKLTFGKTELIFCC